MASSEDPLRVAVIGGGCAALTAAFELTRPEHNGLDLLDPQSPLQLRQDDWLPGPVQITPRIGIRHAADLPLRFAVTSNPCVSGVRSKRVSV